MSTNSLIGKSYINDILSKHSTLVYRLALVITKSKVSANEVVENVFLEYVNHPKGFISDYHLELWFIKTTIEFSKKFFRRNLVKFTNFTDKISFENSKQEILYNKVLSISEKNRIVFHLYYCEDMSIEEISKFFNCNKADIKRKICISRNRIGKMMENEYDHKKLKKEYKKANARIVLPLEYLYKLSRNMMGYKEFNEGAQSIKKYRKIAIAAILFLSIGILSISTNFVYGDYDKDTNNGLKITEYDKSINLSKGDFNYKNLAYAKESSSEGADEDNGVEEWSETKYIDYLGLDPRPTYIPENFKEMTSNNQIEVMSEDRTLECDNFNFYYVGEDNSYISIDVSKGQLPVYSSSYKENSSSISIVDDEISYSEDLDTKDEHFKEFMHNNIGYSITAKGVSEEDFIKMISSIIQK